MTNINWPEIPSATEDQKRAADLLIRTDDGRELRTGYDGGWLNIADATHDVDNKQAISADTSTLMTIDGEGDTTENRYRRGLDLDVWSDDTFRPRAVGEAYMVRITMRAAKATSQDTTIELDLGIGTGFATIISDERRPMTKAQGVGDVLSFVYPIFCLETFGTFGGRFFIRASRNITVWNKAIFIQRTHSP